MFQTISKKKNIKMTKLENYIFEKQREQFMYFILDLSDYLNYESLKILVKNIHKSPYISIELIKEIDKIIYMHGYENDNWYEFYNDLDAPFYDSIFRYVIGNQISEKEWEESDIEWKFNEYHIKEIQYNEYVSDSFAKDYLDPNDYFYFYHQRLLDDQDINQYTSNIELMNLEIWDWFYNYNNPSIPIDNFNFNIINQTKRTTRNYTPRYKIKDTYIDYSMNEKNNSYNFKSLPENRRLYKFVDRYSGRNWNSSYNMYLNPSIHENYDLTDLMDLYYSKTLKDTNISQFDQTPSSTWNSPNPLTKLKTLISINSNITFKQIIDIYRLKEDMLILRYLFDNTFKYQMEVITNECKLFWQKKCIVENYLFKCIWDPRSSYRKAILNKEYDTYLVE